MKGWAFKTLNVANDASPCLDTGLLIPQKTSPPLVPALVSPSLHLSRCLGLATQIQKTQYFFSNSSFIDKMVTIIYSTGDLGPIINGKHTLRIRFLASDSSSIAKVTSKVSCVLFELSGMVSVWFCANKICAYKVDNRNIVYTLMCKF